MTNQSNIRLTSAASVLALVSTAIAAQNDITVVSAEVVKLDGKTEGQPKGERVRLVLSGDGVGDPTRRYFLRNNSAFSTLIEDAGVHMAAPKKSRDDANYTLFFGLDPKVTAWQPAPAPKEERVKMTPEQRSAARLAGKQAKRAQRAAALVAEAEGQPVAA